MNLTQETMKRIEDCLQFILTNSFDVHIVEQKAKEALAEAERAAIVEAEKDRRMKLKDAVNVELVLKNEKLTTERDAYKEALAEIKKECLNNHRGAMQSVNRIVKLINEILQKFNNTNQTKT